MIYEGKSDISSKNDISNANDEDQDSLSLGSESEEFGSNSETLSNQHADGRKTKRNAHGGKKKKRKKNPRANAGTSAKKISKAASDQDLPNGAKRDGLPRGVYELRSGKFQTEIWWRGKNRCIGTFDTPEQASAAYVSVKKDLGDIELSALGADEINAAFDAVKREHWRQ